VNLPANYLSQSLNLAY